MVTVCWSPKGGSGTTVTAVGCAIAAAHQSPVGALGIDLADDWPAVLGITAPQGASLTDWLESADRVAHDALARLEHSVSIGNKTLGLLTGGPFGRAGHEAYVGSLARLVEQVKADGRPCFVDAAAAPGAARSELIANCDRSLLVVRACYLALRLVAQTKDRVDGVILLDEPGRALTEQDVSEVVGAPVVARLVVARAVARSVDSGLFGRRLPRELNPLRRLVA